MSSPNQTNLTIAEAQKILEAFSKLESKSVGSLDSVAKPKALEKAKLGQALLLITSLSDYQNFGICADTTEEGLLALESYLKALGYADNFNPAAEIPSVAGSVYIKFNNKKGSIYLDSYTEKYRGVLVSCQSAEYESINATYGHLPLDLFSPDC